MDPRIAELEARKDRLRADVEGLKTALWLLQDRTRTDRQQLECATVVGTKNAKVSPVKRRNCSLAERLATTKHGVDESQILVRKPGLQASRRKSD